MTLISAQARHLIKSRVPRNSRFLGISFPDRETTKSLYLTPVGNEIYTVTPGKSAVVTLSGAVRVGLNYLDIDYGAFSSFAIPSLKRRPRICYDQVVVLWSHYWSTYYHWLIDVAPKISTAIHYFGSKINEVSFIYPRGLEPYETETIEMLGIRRSQIVNPQEVGSVRSNHIFVLPLPGWCAVSSRIHQFRQSLIAIYQPNRRLYIARIGKRRIVNELALVKMLEGHGFEFIPDVSRSLAEQIELFGSASHIVTPHGAALSNILWANERSKTLELASASYSPDYFRNLASVLGLSFNRLHFGAKRNHWTNGAEDFLVDVDMVNRFLSDKWEI